MKEFLLGGLLAIWVVILGISTLDISFALLAVLYPVALAMLAINYDKLKRVMRLKSQKNQKRMSKKFASS